jgi:two-component system, OmpR family, response regulator VicR
MDNLVNYNILYVEDDPDMIALVQAILSRHNFSVTGASSGPQAFEIIKKQIPDLILLDLMMPGMDGWDIYHQLKASDSTRNLPIIVVTARAQAIDRVLGLHIAKVDDYVCKPFRPQELIDSIRKVLSSNK